MKLEVFKATFMVPEIKMYPAKVGDRRFGVGVSPICGEVKLSASPEFDPKAPTFVYPADAGKYEKGLFWLSNNSGKEAEFTL